ncbi:hypothetical protein HDU91_002052 [Kappamyces sp. JEL0680]|nr:hypothetical protein HDU91_002052 [Kappamyces sp. JEL0680]
MSNSRKQPSDQDISVSSDYTVDVDRAKPKNRFVSATTNVVSNVSNGAKKGAQAVGGVLDDFKEFLNRGNVVDLAVGLVIGAAFTAVVNSMVKDLFTPLISLAMDSVSLSDAFVVMACPKANNGTGPRPSPSSCSKSFNTVLSAQTAGAITWNYGSFINNVITFLITAFILFFIVKAYAAAFRRKPAAKNTKECPECCKDIPLKATRCAFCTSVVHD